MKIDATHQIIVLNLRDPTERQLAGRMEHFIIHNRQAANTGCGSASPGAAVHGFINNTMTDFVIMVNPGFKVLYRNADGRFESPHTEQEIIANIIAYCIIKESATNYEIWDVCVLGPRGTGIGPVFINLLCTNIPALLDLPRGPKPFWLIVVPGNTAAAKTYLRNGFSIGGITLLDSSNMLSGFATPNILMTCPNPSVRINNDAQVPMFTSISDILQTRLRAQNLNIYLAGNILSNMETLVSALPLETCGSLFVTGIVDNPDHRILRLGMSKSITKGTLANPPNPQSCAVPNTDFGYHIHVDALGPLNLHIVQIPSGGDITASIVTAINSAARHVTMCAQFIFLRHGIFTVTISPEFAEFLFIMFGTLVQKATFLDGVELISNSVNGFVAARYDMAAHQYSLNRMLPHPHADINVYADAERDAHATQICQFINTITVQDVIAGDPTGRLIATILQYQATVKNAINLATTQVVTATYHPVTDIHRINGINIVCPNVLLTDIARVRVYNPADPEFENAVIPEFTLVRHFQETADGGTFRL
jgi:hypothetical protein